MIDERMLKARMLNLLKGVEEELPALCEKLGANPRETTVAILSTMKTVVHMINNLAEKGCWIPCSEDMPKDTKTKFITFSDGSVEAGYYSEGKWWCIGDGINLEVKTKGVIAWMPLPEPYKEGDKE